ncbi:prolipoprotein diacylglyceryl transferase [uncultured Helicobacter sp.]|uniref:prolipoprotein diacylglyceryl transferase n=1 Tax=uncultured Helicobacter sp. TaxID=175537 RepID=UPI002597F303|nr:prolipoprotein diacylglyceryl transferase [uncultured Helicobacter sp.]
MSFWNDIYQKFDPIAFSVFGFPMHWYGIAYVCALLFAFFVAKIIISRAPNRFPISSHMLDSYFIWAEIGVILGARIGYIIIYDPMRFWYLAHPWQIFNIFDTAGNFVGIRGMSYHGAIIGFLLASWIFARLKKQSFLLYLDLAALSIPLAYVFGRIGNFLNQELYGRVVLDSDTFGQMIGIIVDGTLRYPSQLLEAFLEGVVVFIIVLVSARLVRTKGMLIAIYAISYGVMRFIAEYWREPDSQMGLFFGLSMGQILCCCMILCGSALMLYLRAHPKQIKTKANTRKDK